jgi:hypothetical protein
LQGLFYIYEISDDNPFKVKSKNKKSKSAIQIEIKRTIFFWESTKTEEPNAYPAIVYTGKTHFGISAKSHLVANQ